MNTYKLYLVRNIKGMMMFDYICQELADNIIEAEDMFEKSERVLRGQEYMITITRQ